MLGGSTPRTDARARFFSIDQRSEGPPLSTFLKIKKMGCSSAKPSSNASDPGQQLVNPSSSSSHLQQPAVPLSLMGPTNTNSDSGGGMNLPAPHAHWQTFGVPLLQVLTRDYPSDGSGSVRHGSVDREVPRLVSRLVWEIYTRGTTVSIYLSI